LINTAAAEKWISQGYILDTNNTSGRESSEVFEEHTGEYIGELITLSEQSFLKKEKNGIFTIILDKCENKACPYSKRKLNIIQIRTNRTKCLKLCQFCAKAWKNGQYCSYCITIYKDNSHSDGKDWICCDSCGSWQHVVCEEKKGTYHNLAKQLSDENFQYFCPLCKHKKLKKKRTTQKNDFNCIQKFNF
jgi:hypothetical protein